MKNKQHTYSLGKPTAPRWVLAVVCLFFITSCGNLYTGEEEIFNPDVDPDVWEESVPVMVAFSDPYYNILSTGRGVGKIDPQDTCFVDKMNPVDKDGKPLDDEKPRFFVYAFRKNYPYYITRVDDPKTCLVDGSCGLQAAYAANNPQENLQGHGKWAHYNGNGSFVNWHFIDDKLYYPNGNDEQNISYDFFAYFHDGAASGEITRDDDRISFPVKIDGSQDLMCGAAVLTPEQLETIDKMEDEEERQAIKQFHYSAFSGRRNVWPIFQMKHQLAYVKVNLIAGNAYGDPVKVHDIRLETHTQGTFVVAAKDKGIGAFFDGSGVEQLSLRDVTNGKAILPGEDEPATQPNENGPDSSGGNAGTEGEQKPAYDGPTWKKLDINLQYNEDGSKPPPVVAGELLVPAGNNLVLHTLFSNKDTNWEPELTVLSLKDKITTEMDGYSVNGVVAGRTYNLNLTVYGPKNISIEVEATAWQEGGDIEIDTEIDKT